MKRIARAEVEAKKIELQGQFDMSQMANQVQALALGDYIEKGANLHNITYEVAQELPADIEITEPEQDWLDHFKSKAEIISDEKMQTLWGRILAGELQAKGRFSKRAMDFVSAMSADEAQLIEQLCRGIIWRGDEATLAIGTTGDYKNLSHRQPFLTESNLIYLSGIGVVTPNTCAVLQVPHESQRHSQSFKQAILDFNKEFRLVYNRKNEDGSDDTDMIKINICDCTLTSIGLELAYLARIDVNDEDAQYVRDQVIADAKKQNPKIDVFWAPYKNA